MEERKGDLITVNKPNLLQAHSDPVIEQKRLAVERMMGLHSRGFKRVDIQLLQMPSPFDSSYPIFAVQSVEAYERGAAASFGGDAHNIDGRQLFRELLSGQGFMSGSATPKGNIPQSAKAVLASVNHEFDNVFVVWDASREWVSVSSEANVEAGADPLILGDVDGVWFCIAKWDLTKLESYFLD